MNTIYFWLEFKTALAHWKPSAWRGFESDTGAEMTLTMNIQPLLQLIEVYHVAIESIEAAEVNLFFYGNLILISVRVRRDVWVWNTLFIRINLRLMDQNEFVEWIRCKPSPFIQGQSGRVRSLNVPKFCFKNFDSKFQPIGRGEIWHSKSGGQN